MEKFNGGGKNKRLYFLNNLCHFSPSTCSRFRHGGWVEILVFFLVGKSKSMRLSCVIFNLKLHSHPDYKDWFLVKSSFSKFRPKFMPIYSQMIKKNRKRWNRKNFLSLCCFWGFFLFGFGDLVCVICCV